MENALSKWGKAVFRAKWLIVALWLVFIILGGSVFGKLPDLLSGGGWAVQGSQSKIAAEWMASEFAGRSDSSLTLVLRDPKHPVGSPEYNENLSKIAEGLKQETGVVRVFSILDATEGIRKGLIGEDKNMSIAFVDMDISPDYAANRITAYQERLVKQAESLGVEAHLVGTVALNGENSEQSKKGLAKAEMVVFPLIIIILMLVFRSAVATVTPLIVTLASVVVAMGIVYWTATQVELSVFVTNSTMMLGLGVGIDYSLFLVSRFKQELENNQSTADALSKTMATAGHTVLFSAITVIAALSALFVVPLPVIKAIAFGGVAVVFAAGLASLTLLPAILGILGHRIHKGKIPFLSETRRTGTTGGWKRWTYAIMRRPALFLVMSLALLAVLAWPAAGLKLYSPDTRILPGDSGVRQGFAMLEDSFGKGATSPINIVLHNENMDLRTPEALSKISALHDKLEKDAAVKGISSVASFFPGVDVNLASALLRGEGGSLPDDVKYLTDRFISKDGHTAVIELKTDYNGSSDTAREAVTRLRDTVLPGNELPKGTGISIGGETMSGMETSEAIKDSLPSSLAIMLVLIFIILVVTFRSVFLPLKAILLNLISVAATYGILVLVMGKGYGAELFGVPANGSIIHFVPVLLLALLFGLSTDYEVFLVSRVKEEFEKTGNNESSIAEGMEKTGPLITGAAVLMFAVFAGFAFSGVVPVQMLGFGMAVAIALDATVIRLLLVPVSMKLMGRINWWFPIRKKAHSPKGWSPLAPAQGEPEV